MRALLLVAATCLTPILANAQANPGRDSLLAAIKKDSTLANSIGFFRLTPQEQRNLANLLYGLSSSSQAGSTVPSTRAGGASRPDPGVRRTMSLTKVNEASGSVLQLLNGAVVEVTTYALSYVGYKNALLIQAGSGCRIWVEGKRTYPCELIRPPTVSRSVGRLDALQSVRGSGKVLQLASGKMYEVSFQAFETQLWLAGSEVVDLEDGRLINLDSGEIVDVKLIR